MMKKAEVVDVLVDGISDAQTEVIKTLEGVISITIEENSLPGQRQLRLQLESLDSLHLVFDFLFKQKIRLINFRREEPTLEDVFIELTGRSAKKNA
jgi:ABC-type uncharacterized transport system ATPase subunit